MINKKILSTFVLIAAMLILAACGSSPAAENASAESADSAAMDESMPDASMEMAADAVISEGSGFCSNAFFPLRSDKTWTYNVVSGDTESTFSWTFKDITDSSFTIVQDFPSLTNEISWQCGPDGMLSSTYANMAMDSSVDVTYDTLEVNGVALPSDDEWEVGKVWDMTYTVQVTINNEAMTVQADGEIATTRTIAAIETITVPAGTYPEAYRVDSTGQLTIDLMGTQSTTPLVYSDWYVSGVGLVKSASSNPDLAYDMQLISFE